MPVPDDNVLPIEDQQRLPLWASLWERYRQIRYELDMLMTAEAAYRKGQIPAGAVTHRLNLLSAAARRMSYKAAKDSERLWVETKGY